tara:strand:- start:1593 stop:2018 length:426 start_codon:yes stop_codon:yes gene_type:complete
MSTLEKSLTKVEVLQWTETLCRALEQQYKNYAVRSCIRNNSTEMNPYLQERINKLENDEECMKFTITSGKKYHKIIQNDYRNGKYESAGVHAFVDKMTGEVYKPASWKAPAKHVRFDMRDINQREWMLANCDWAGGYLYIR